MNWLWQHYTTIAQAWSNVAWLLIGIGWAMFGVGSKVFTACFVARWFWRGAKGDTNGASIEPAISGEGATPTEQREPQRTAPEGCRV